MRLPLCASSRRYAPRLTRTRLPSGARSHRRESSWPYSALTWTSAWTVGGPRRVVPWLLGPSITAVPAACSLATVLQASLFAIGSIAAPVAGLPPSLVTVCGAAEPNRKTPGWIAVHDTAANGPSPGAFCGHVWVKVVTVPGAGAPEPPRRCLPKNELPWSFRYSSAFSLLEPRECPRSPNCSVTSAPGFEARSEL